MPQLRKIPRIDDPKLLKRFRNLPPTHQRGLQGAPPPIGGVVRGPDFSNVRSFTEAGVPASQALGFDAPRVLAEEGPRQLRVAPQAQQAPAAPTSQQLQQAPNQPPPIVEAIKERQNLLGKIAKVLEDPNVGAALSQFGMALTARDPNSFGFQLNAAHLQRHQAAAAGDLQADLAGATTEEERQVALRQRLPLTFEQRVQVVQDDVSRRMTERQLSDAEARTDVEERRAGVEEDLVQPRIGELEASADKQRADTARTEEETDFLASTRALRKQSLETALKVDEAMNTLRLAQAGESGATAGLRAAQTETVGLETILGAAGQVTRQMGIVRQELNDTRDALARVPVGPLDPKTGTRLPHPLERQLMQQSLELESRLRSMREALDDLDVGGRSVAFVKGVPYLIDTSEEGTGEGGEERGAFGERVKPRKK